MVVGRSEYSLRAASEALPMRDAFAVLFFVSVGMLLDPGALMDLARLWWPARWRSSWSGSRWSRSCSSGLLQYPFRTALTVAIALAQIGEFSFILASLGRDLGVLTATATNVLVATSIASIVLNPIAYRGDPSARAMGDGERPRLRGRF